MNTNKELFTLTLDQARLHLGKKQFHQAKKLYYSLQNYADSIEEKVIAWAELSWTLYYLNEYDKAIEAAENVLILNPEYRAIDDLYRLQGFAYLALNKLELAERMLAMSLEMNTEGEKQLFVKYELGKLHFNKGYYDLAYPYFYDVKDRFSQTQAEYYLSVLFYIGFIHYYLENYTESRVCFKTILDSNPAEIRRASAYFGLAFLEFHSKNYLNVISLCENIIKLDATFFDRESLGFLTAASYFYLGRMDIFKEYSEQMAKGFPHGRYNSKLKKMMENAGKKLQ